MPDWQRTKRTLLLGLIVGLAFGSVNLLFTWLYPLADDTPMALLRFYGPMFFVWALASFRAARRSGRLLSGVTTGMIVAFATFMSFDLFILLRVNLFLNELTGRADWQSMMLRFRGSDVDNLRLFVNLDYVKRGASQAWRLLRHRRGHGRCWGLSGAADAPAHRAYHHNCLTSNWSRRARGPRDQVAYGARLNWQRYAAKPDSGHTEAPG